MLEPAIKDSGLVILAHTEITDHFGNVSREAHAAFGSANTGPGGHILGERDRDILHDAFLGEHESCVFVFLCQGGITTPAQAISRPSACQTLSHP